MTPPTPLTWEEVSDAAEAISWVTHVASVGRDGRPHVAVAAPGLAEEGRIWFATRRGSQKYRNLEANGEVAFHWPVTTGSGPGELFARGVARLHETDDDRRRLWNRVVPYDMTNFWGSPDNRDLIFVETRVTYVSLLGPEFTRRTWKPG
ncbi:MAG: pyridoxamine 5'-phosphate oxidase family protein [Actinomycetota bacterium]